MEYAQLGSTELTVSRVAFGTAPLGELFGPVSEGQAMAIVHEALEFGITFVDTSPYYGSAEERLGKALAGRRDEVVLGTKVGRLRSGQFDFTPARIRRSVEHSLRLLGTDYVDILQLHDIEFVPWGPIAEDSYAELSAIRDEGKCRCIGMTGYPAFAMTRAMLETELDVLLTWAHATLLDDTLERQIAPVANQRGVGLINAAAVVLGLLTPGGSNMQADHPATAAIRASAARMVSLCENRGVDVAFVANQYSIQRSGCATTVIGTAKSHHLRSSVAAADRELDEELIKELLVLRPPLDQRTWINGLPENNG